MLMHTVVSSDELSWEEVAKLQKYTTGWLENALTACTDSADRCLLTH